MTNFDPKKGKLGYWMSAAAASFPDKVALFDLSRETPSITTYASLEARLKRLSYAKDTCIIIAKSPCLAHGSYRIRPR